MKKVLFVYDHLQLGGIATYLINFLGCLDTRKLSVTLLVKSVSDDVLAAIPEGVSIKYLRDISPVKKIFHYTLRGALPAAARIVLRKKKSVVNGRAAQKIQLINAKISNPHSEHYDVAIGADIYWAAYYTAIRINADKKYVWIHPQYNSLGNDVTVDEKIFATVNKIFAVSSHNGEILKGSLLRLADKIDYMDNITDNDSIRKRGSEICPVKIEQGCFNIATVCRIDNSSKRIDRIVDAASLLAGRGIDFVWRIVGDGPDRDYIEELIRKEGLTDRLLLMGGYSNPHPIVANSDAFVLLSQYEGVPLVVTEAMILGVPVVVTHYESATSQVSAECGTIIDNNDTTVAQQAADALFVLFESGRRRVEYSKDNGESYKKINEILGGDYICQP